MDCIQGISFYQDEYNNVWVTRRSKNAVFVKVKSDYSALKNSDGTFSLNILCHFV